MSVATTARKQQFTLDGATADFTFTFRALTSAPSDIKCMTTTSGTDTIHTYTTDYTVSVNSNGVGGTLSLVDPAGIGLGTLTVYRETTNKQESDYDDYNQFPADTLETDLDIRTLVSQEQDEGLDRTLKLSISTTDVSAELPAPEANKVLSWNDAADALKNVDVVGQGSIELPIPVANGGTAGETAAEARTNLSAAKSGFNSDITGMASVTITSGTITTLQATTATISTLKITTENVTTATIGTLSVTTLTGVTFVTTGSILLWPTDTAPSGYVLCDGSAISRTTYSDLFAIISTDYGVGDGSTTFNVPNLKGKVPVGFNSAEGEFDALGETGGAKTHSLVIGEIPHHYHKVDSGTAGHTVNSSTTTDGPQLNYAYGTEPAITAHNNLQPYIALNFIIKT